MKATLEDRPAVRRPECHPPRHRRVTRLHPVMHGSAIVLLSSSLPIAPHRVLESAEWLSLPLPAKRAIVTIELAQAGRLAPRHECPWPASSTYLGINSRSWKAVLQAWAPIARHARIHWSPLHPMDRTLPQLQGLAHPERAIIPARVSVANRTSYRACTTMLGRRLAPCRRGCHPGRKTRTAARGSCIPGPCKRDFEFSHGVCTPLRLQEALRPRLAEAGRQARAFIPTDPSPPSSFRLPRARSRGPERSGVAGGERSRTKESPPSRPARFLGSALQRAS